MDHRANPTSIQLHFTSVFNDVNLPTNDRIKKNKFNVILRIFHLSFKRFFLTIPE